MKIIKSFASRQIAGENLLIPIEETTKDFNGMFELTDTAKFIWDHYESTDSLDEMVALITEEYEVEEELARRDVVGFTNTLLQAGFIALTKEDGSW